ncbi:DUF6415 family natural product biosynthesis protein [Streptomyces bacillaris]|uniref:DUF6415 family natural product biosynthesis protein n=1 Tax=Streptomyces bacillaris TaxID=68179 RepID=UPI0036FFA9B3
MTETAPTAEHPLSQHVPEKHIPPGTPELYADLLKRLRAWTPLPIREIVATLDRVLESPVPPPDRDLVYVHRQLRSWHERLGRIATADRRFPPAEGVLLLVQRGMAIGEEPIGGGVQVLGIVRRLASVVADLLDHVMLFHPLRDEDDE